MKKIISFVLAALMLVSAVPTALATNDYTQGTQVVYTATGSESYTITVPAQLAPGGNGIVTLSGTWADNRIVTVSADPTVTLTNSIKAEDQKVLNVNFDGISEAGSNTTSQTFTQGISVAAIENALFGTWSGKFNYNVETSDVGAVESALVYNAWYRNTESGMSVLLVDEDTVFFDGLFSPEFSIINGLSGLYRVSDNSLIDSENNEFGTISTDGQTVTLNMDSALDFTLDTSTLNTQLHYFNYIHNDTHIVFTPGMTWEEFCDDVNFLWAVNDDGLVYDYDHGIENLYPVMYEDRSHVKGTDLVVENTLYICDKP